MKNKTWLPLLIVAALIGGAYALFHFTSEPITQETTATSSAASSSKDGVVEVTADDLAKGNVDLDQAVNATDEEASTNPALAMKGQQLPAFSVLNTKDEAVESSIFYDKPMFIMAFASWCPYCQSQMPAVQKLYEKYKDKVNFVFLDMTGWNNETKETAQKYIDENDYTFTFYQDIGLAVADQLQVETIPSMFFVDGNQTIQTVYASVEDFDTLETAIKDLL